MENKEVKFVNENFETYNNVTYLFKFFRPKKKKINFSIF